MLRCLLLMRTLLLTTAAHTAAAIAAASLQHEAVLLAHYRASVPSARLCAAAACRLCDVEANGRVIHGALPQLGLGPLLAAVESHVSHTLKWVAEVSNARFSTVSVRTVA
jgi:hypothetical protein